MNTKILCDKSLLDNIGDAIRSRVGTTDKMTITQLATGAGYNEDLTAELTEQAEIIASLEEAVAGKAGGGSAVLDSLTVTENGTYRPLPGVDGFNEVIVNVASSGGSQPSGVCPSLTIDCTDYTIQHIYYFQNNICKNESLFTDSCIITNIDINQEIFIVGYGSVGGNFNTAATNLNVVSNVNNGMFVVKCTSDQPATLSIEEEGYGWG